MPILRYKLQFIMKFFADPKQDFYIFFNINLLFAGLKYYVIFPSNVREARYLSLVVILN